MLIDNGEDFFGHSVLPSFYKIPLLYRNRLTFMLYWFYKWRVLSQFIPTTAVLAFTGTFYRNIGVFHRVILYSYFLAKP